MVSVVRLRLFYYWVFGNKIRTKVYVIFYTWAELVVFYSSELNICIGVFAWAELAVFVMEQSSQ